MVSVILTIFISLFANHALATDFYIHIGATGCSTPTDTDYNPATGTCGSGSATVYNHTTISSMTAVAAGDTIYLRAGTYTTAIALGSKVGGTGSSQFIKLIKYPSETVTFQKPAPAGGASSDYNITATCTAHNFWFEGLIFDGINGVNDISRVIHRNCGFTPAVETTIPAYFVFVGNEFKNHYAHVALVKGTYWRFTNNYFHDQRADCWLNNSGLPSHSAHMHYNLYVNAATDVEISGNEMTGGPGGSMQVYPGPNISVSIHHNYIHDNTWCSNQGYAIIIGNSSNGTLFYNNIVVSNGQFVTSQTGVDGLSIWGGVDSVSMLNNIFYNNRDKGVEITHSGSTGIVFQNNLSVGNGGSAITVASGAGVTQTTNRTTGSITDCTVSTSNFTHKSASSCINAGTAISGTSYNGSAPDQGAFETFVFSSCQVPNGSSSIIRVSFTNNLNPPILPASSFTGVTARKNGGSNTVVSSTRNGTNQIDLTMTNSYVGGDTVDISASSTNITDSVVIGSTVGTTFYQPYVGTLTNQSCTNNAGGAPAYTYTQARYEFHSVDGTEAAPRMKPDGVASTGAAENFTTLPVRKGGSVRIRFALVCGGADCPDTAFYIYYAQGGAYALIPDTFGSGNVATCGAVGSSPSSGTETTNQLSTAGTFTPGGYVNTSNAVPEVAGFLNGYKTENEYCVKFDTDASGTYTFRAYLQDGIALNTYTVTPTVTITESKMGAGF